MESQVYTGCYKISYTIIWVELSVSEMSLLIFYPLHFENKHFKEKSMVISLEHLRYNNDGWNFLLQIIIGVETCAHLH